jgi:type II secretory pathway component PulF
MRYRSTYLEADGTQGTAVLEAADEQRLHQTLHEGGRTLLRAKPLDSAEPAVRSRRLPQRKLLMLVQSLESSLDVGVPLITALTAILEHEPDRRTRAMYQDIVERVSGGAPLSAAMAAYPQSFSPVFRALVHAGESSGSLPRVFAALAADLEWRLELGSVARQAMVYPIVVLSAGYGLVLFLLAFVLPRLGDVLAKIGGELPAASRALIELSGFVAGHLPGVLAATAGAVAAFVVVVRSDGGKSALAAMLARLPVARDVLRTLGLAQLCHNLSVLLDAGLMVTDSLALSGNALAVRRTRQSVLAARERILGGAKVTEAVARSALLPPVAICMVRIGEEGGSLPKSFARLSAMYDRQVKEAVKKAIALLEPLVTVLLGVIVGGVAALAITTIYSAMQGIGR